MKILGFEVQFEIECGDESATAGRRNLVHAVF